MIEYINAAPKMGHNPIDLSRVWIWNKDYMTFEQIDELANKMPGKLQNLETYLYSIAEKDRVLYIKNLTDDLINSYYDVRRAINPADKSLKTNIERRLMLVLEDATLCVINRSVQRMGIEYPKSFINDLRNRGYDEIFLYLMETTKEEIEAIFTRAESDPNALFDKEFIDTIDAACLNKQYMIKGGMTSYQIFNDPEKYSCYIEIKAGEINRMKLILKLMQEHLKKKGAPYKEWFETLANAWNISLSTLKKVSRNYSKKDNEFIKELRQIREKYNM